MNLPRIRLTLVSDSGPIPYYSHSPHTVVPAATACHGEQYTIFQDAQFIDTNSNLNFQNIGSLTNVYGGGKDDLDLQASRSRMLGRGCKTGQPQSKGAHFLAMWSAQTIGSYARPKETATFFFSIRYCFIVRSLLRIQNIHHVVTMSTRGGNEGVEEGSWNSSYSAR
ncbi:hypothetical protein JOM56_009172 [Amanita muscaria]